MQHARVCVPHRATGNGCHGQCWLAMSRSNPQCLKGARPTRSPTLSCFPKARPGSCW